MVTEHQFVMVSEWMGKGTINEFVKADTNADRLGLVCLSFKVLIFICH
jgi:hypothetical protein